MNKIKKTQTEQLFKPTGVEFYDNDSKREMMWIYNEDEPWADWIFYKHPDGQWVSLRKISEQEKQILLKLLHG